MSENTQSLIIRTGSDPRHLPEFIAIREEVNKSSHPSQPEMNWRLVESLALTLFRNSGVDLQTACYYTLARTYLHGLVGFTEGCELLAGLIVGQWDSLWPPQTQARVDMLEWFNSRVGNQMRQQSFSPDDLRLIYRSERALQLIVDKLQQVELKRIPRIENLLYLMQNQVRNLEKIKEQSQIAEVKPLQMPPLVYISGSDAHAELRRTPEPAVAAEPKIKVSYAAEPLVSKTAASKARRRSLTAAHGFILGIVCSLLVGGTLYLLQVRPMQQQLASVQTQPEGAALAWLAQPQIADYGNLLERLSNRSPLALLSSGDQMVHLAQQRWPDDEQQRMESRRWQQLLQARMGNQPISDNYYQAQRRLQQLADRLLEQERQNGSITISYLKTVVYQIQNSLAGETPLDELLRQLAVQNMQDRTATLALMKRIDDRFTELLSRYHRLAMDAEAVR